VTHLLPSDYTTILQLQRFKIKSIKFQDSIKHTKRRVQIARQGKTLHSTKISFYEQYCAFKLMDRRNTRSPGYISLSARFYIANFS